MGSKGLSHLVSIGVGTLSIHVREFGTGNSEIASIGVCEKVVGLRECGGKKLNMVVYTHVPELSILYGIIKWTLFMELPPDNPGGPVAGMGESGNELLQKFWLFLRCL